MESRKGSAQYVLELSNPSEIPDGFITNYIFSPVFVPGSSSSDHSSMTYSVLRVALTVLPTKRVTEIHKNYNIESYSVQYLATNQNYSTPYTPLYPGSPATKKYVDDAIATNVTTMLNGSY